MNKPNGAQSVDRALSLLMAISQYKSEGATLAELGDQLALTKPTCRRLLLALIRSDLVEQVAERNRYRLGRAAYLIGNLASPHYRLLDHYQSSPRRLAEITGDTCILTVRQGDFSIALARDEGEYAIRSHTIQPGARLPLGVGASGIAMLSAMEDEEVEDILLLNADVIAKKHPKFTEEIIWRSVRDARRVGYSINKGLFFKHSWGVAAPIKLPSGRVIGAITVSALDHRMTEKHTKFVVSAIHKELETVARNRATIP